LVRKVRVTTAAAAARAGLDVTGVEAAREEEVAGQGLVHERRARPYGVHHVYDRGPRFVVHAHARGGVLGRVPVRRDHRGDRLAHVSDERPREDRLLGLDVAWQGRARAHAMAGDGVVAAGDDRHHAGVARGRARVHVA
jgi:hypothetical protein